METAAFLAALPSRGAPESTAEPVLVNGLGFAADGPKYCMIRGTKPSQFDIIESSSRRSVWQGMSTACAGDHGAFLVGDFTDLTQAGVYRVRAGAFQSEQFAVERDIYTPAIGRCVSYFKSQRCGDLNSEARPPCHLDDGQRLDDGRLHDVTGGWHDACDLRKWVDATIYGAVGLSRVLDLVGTVGFDRDRVSAELRWGNQYFRKMQEPAGYVMNFCGGDDGNRYTDNKRGTADDRAIHCEPCELPAQFHFIAAQAATARHTRERDPAYAQGCEDAARRCLDWCTTNRSAGAAISLSAAIIACVQLHRTTGKGDVRDKAAGYAARLLALQVTEPLDLKTSLVGFFRATPDRPDPVREIMHGNLPLIALCEISEWLADHAEAGTWRRALKLHVDYLVTLSSRSAFGTIPFGLYVDRDPGGNRRIGPYWYRWFMKPYGEYAFADWWVGINAHLASNGVGLVKASKLLGDSRLLHLAQRQFDWILGVNPFNASTVSGAGRNQPPLYMTTAFKPATPAIAGGVMNGIGGTSDDEPTLSPRSYQTCEYWTPVVAYTMWLAAELQVGSARMK